MNPQEYIASGILTDYVFGLTTPEESRVVERLAAENPEIASELADLQQGLENYALANAVKPPASVKQAIMSRLAEESSQTSGAAVIASESSAQANVRSLRRWKVTTAAAVILFAVSAYVAITQYNVAVEVADDRTSTQAAVDSLNRQLKSSEAALAEAQSRIQQAPQLENSVIFSMQAVEETESHYAILAWQETDHRVFLRAGTLPKTEADQQYQLWAIVDGQPMPMGVFDADSSHSFVDVGQIEHADAFAVTVEPRGGSEIPNLESLIVQVKA